MCVQSRLTIGPDEAPAELLSSDRQSPELGQGNQAVADVVGLPVGLGDSLKEVRGVEFRPIDHHPPSFRHHST